MNMPGFAAEASLGRGGGAYLGRDTAPADRRAVTPQAEVCDVGYIGDWPGLYVVCCDPDRRPPCVATGLV